MMLYLDRMCRFGFHPVPWFHIIIIIIIIIIVIKKGWQCKAGRERLTPYQSGDPNPTTPTHRIKEEKGITSGDKK